MNKKTVVIASGATGLILALGGCDKGTYEYEVSGTVQEQYVDYEDCPGVDLAMDTVAFVAGGTKPGGGTGKKSSNSDTSDKKADDKKKDSKVQAPQGGVQQAQPQSGQQGGRKSATPSATPKKNTGVKLKSKPDKPERIKSGKVPKPTYKSKPDKGCKDEYEIFVLANDGELYEQDVRKADYDKCLAAKSDPKFFPLCTKG